MNPSLHPTEEMGSYKLPVYPGMLSVRVLRTIAIEKKRKELIGLKGKLWPSKSLIMIYNVVASKTDRGLHYFIRANNAGRRRT